MYCEPAEENHDIDMSYCAWPTCGCVHQYILYVKAKKKKYTPRSTSQQPPVPQHQFHQQQQQQKYQQPYILCCTMFL